MIESYVFCHRCPLAYWRTKKYSKLCPICLRLSDIAGMKNKKMILTRSLLLRDYLKTIKIKDGVIIK